MDAAEQFRPWTEAELKTARECWPDHSLSQAEIVRRVGRSASAIRTKARSLGWPKRGHPKHRSDAWSESKVFMLKRMKDQGYSAGQIANILGTTRSAVLGKLHRLGLSNPRDNGGYHGHYGVGKPRPKRKPKVKKRQGNFSFTMRSNRSRTEPTEATDIAIQDDIEPRKLTILELTNSTCRWPLWQDGDSEKLYCGLETHGHVYCPHHRRRAVSSVLKAI